MLYLLFLKNRQNLNLSSAANLGGALRVNFGSILQEFSFDFKSCPKHKAELFLNIYSYEKS